MSLRLILQEVLQKTARERANDQVYLGREIVREPPRALPFLLDDEFHLFVSHHNAGASNFMAMLNYYCDSVVAANPILRSISSKGSSLRSIRRLGTTRTLPTMRSLRSLRTPSRKSASLKVTSDPVQMTKALHFLCYLNADTYTSGAMTALFYSDLLRALRAGMHVLLVHETRLEARGAPFKVIADATPDRVKIRRRQTTARRSTISFRPWTASDKEEKRLYKELAVMICGSTCTGGTDHLNVGLHLLLNAIAVPPPVTSTEAPHEDLETELSALSAEQAAWDADRSLPTLLEHSWNKSKAHRMGTAPIRTFDGSHISLLSVVTHEKRRSCHRATRGEPLSCRAAPCGVRPNHPHQTCGGPLNSLPTCHRHRRPLSLRARFRASWFAQIPRSVSTSRRCAVTRVEKRRSRESAPCLQRRDPSICCEPACECRVRRSASCSLASARCATAWHKEHCRVCKP